MGVFGASAVFFTRPALPYTPAFATGAMVFEVIEEVVPESLRNGFEGTATIGFLAGFLILMSCDVGLG
jgi:ZIP family zinc transporter